MPEENNELSGLELQTMDNSLQLDIMTAFGKLKPLEDRIAMLPTLDNMVEEDEGNNGSE